MKIDYEDIPKDQIDSLRKKAFSQNRVIRLWSALSRGGAVFLALSISIGVFPQKPFIGSLIFSIILSVLLGILFWKAVVDPQIRRAVERMMTQSGKEL